MFNISAKKEKLCIFLYTFIHKSNTTIAPLPSKKGCILLDAALIWSIIYKSGVDYLPTKRDISNIIF